VRLICVTTLSGSVILTVTFATPVSSVTFALTSIVTPVLKTVLFAGVIFITFGGVESTVTITANITENIAIDTVTATLDFDSTSAVVTMTTAGGDLFQANFTNTTFVGEYNITITATDTNGNTNNTETTNFTVRDSTPPNLINFTPANNSVFTTGVTIEISVNATDNSAGVANVTVNITEPDSSVTQIDLTDLGGSDIFNTSYTIPQKNGTYTITFIANDTNGNLNDTEFTFIVGNDTQTPNVTIIEPTTDTLFNQTDVVTITANVTENIAIDSVTATIDFDTTSSIITMTTAGGDLFQTNFTNTTFVGDYNITITATDTNGNTNNTETTNFTVRDSTPPSVINLTPVNNSGFSLGATIEISANVTDNAVANVSINITQPNGTVVEQNLSDNANSDIFNTSFTIPVLTGTYTIRFIANDTNGNVNSSETNFFVASDTVNPVINSVNDTPDPVQQGDSVEITANVTDDVAVDVVIVQIDDQNFTMNQGGITTNKSLFPIEEGTGNGWTDCTDFDTCLDTATLTNHGDGTTADKVSATTNTRMLHLKVEELGIPGNATINFLVYNIVIASDINTSGEGFKWHATDCDGNHKDLTGVVETNSTFFLYNQQFNTTSGGNPWTPDCINGVYEPGARVEDI